MMLLQVCFAQEHLFLVCLTSRVGLGVSDQCVSVSPCRDGGCIGWGWKWMDCFPSFQSAVFSSEIAALLSSLSGVKASESYSTPSEVKPAGGCFHI